MGAIATVKEHKMKIIYAVAAVALIVGTGVLIYRLTSGPSSGTTAGAEGEGGEATAAGERAAGSSDVADMLAQLNATVVKKAEEFFHPAKSMVETTARMLSAYSSLRNDEYFENYVRDVLRGYPQLDNFYIADTTGSRVIAFNRGKAGIETDVIDRTSAEPYRVLKRWDDKNTVVSVERHTEKQLIANPLLGGLNDDRSGIYDATARPWYRKAVKAAATCWSDVYIFNVSRQPGITVAMPALGSEGNPLFVVAADFEVKTISKFLSNMKVGEQGLAFIMNGDGELIAYPEVEKVLKLEGGKPVLAKAEEVVPPWARAALASRGGTDDTIFALTYEGNRYVASFAPFLHQFGNDWQLVVVAPEADLLHAGVSEK